MRRIVFLLPLLFAGCSCQPDPVASSAHEETEPTATAPPGDDASPTAAELANVATPVLSAVAPGAVDEGTTVRNYMYALLDSDRRASDAYWSGGRTSTRPDDAVLRDIQDLRNLRVDTDSPIARDTAQPSRLREVPVRVRAITATGTFRVQGWYRLQPRPDGSGWEILSASLQPALD
ncbi:hypothetical protein J7J08_01115 [Stenotrophomonas sp. ISL-67]|uniref:hypothetical protein n=1 Tax=Stenotrophomonas sp. ISL-67 TaxID=2819171 RepID=UPI001BED2578|nr:hypothetical protein [Stenotrophomonas sp. ISL-67]MBT2766234.1 hypothetical protein [Stenotrophomonas sp. ISL-67]